MTWTKNIFIDSFILVSIVFVFVVDKTIAVLSRAGVASLFCPDDIFAHFSLPPPLRQALLD